MNRGDLEKCTDKELKALLRSFAADPDTSRYKKAMLSMIASFVSRKDCVNLLLGIDAARKSGEWRVVACDPG